MINLFELCYSWTASETHHASGGTHRSDRNSWTGESVTDGTKQSKSSIPTNSSAVALADHSGLDRFDHVTGVPELIV